MTKKHEKKSINSPVRLFLTGTILACIWMAVYIIGPTPLRLLNYRIYDTLLLSLPAKEDHGLPVIIDIDEKSLQEFGQWPWPRYRIARLLTCLEKAGVRCAGLDMVFPEPDRTSLRMVHQEMERDMNIRFTITGFPEKFRDNDELMAEALDSGPFSIGYFFSFVRPESPPGKCPANPVNVGIRKDRHDDSLPENELPLAKDITCSLPVLSSAAQASGFINTMTDEDGILRHAPVLIRYQNHTYPSLGLSTLMKAMQIPQLLISSETGHLKSLDMDITGKKVCIPLGNSGTMLLRYYNSPEYFEYISAADILKDRVSAERIKGRIAFIGTSAMGLGDVHATPVNPVLPGVEIHAVLTENILRNDFIFRPWWTKDLEIILILAVGIFSAVLMIRNRTFTGVLGTGAGGFSLWYGSQWAMTTHRFFISPLYPLLALFTNFTVLTLVNLLREQQRNREQQRELSAAQELTLHSLAALAETRDNETGNHLVRTQYYVRELAEYLAANNPAFRIVLDAETISFLYKSAPLHDIGKVGIPDNILLKPGKLTNDEFDIMKLHTVYGRDALIRAEARLETPMQTPYLRLAQEMAYSHHEKWDGTGYPLKLAGTDIPLAGRLMALADVYDALRSKRVYKPPFTHEEAKAIILEGREKHFDPDIADAFMAVAEQFVRIAETYADEEEA